MSLVGANRIGRYVCLQTNVKENISHLDQVKELSSYIFKMIDFKLSKYINTKNTRVQQCLTLLKERNIIKSKDGKYEIIDPRLL